MKQIAVLTSTILVLAACAGTPETQGTGGKPDRQTAAAVSVPSEGLPPQRLEPGQCGLFLWGMSAPRRFVFFAEGTSGEALILIKDTPTELKMTSAGGEVFGQFLTEMSFANTAARDSVSVSIVPGEPLEGGQRVETGNVLHRDAEGWETILPVTGVRTCMPQ